MWRCVQKVTAAAGFGLWDLYFQASLELWVSFQATRAGKEPTWCDFIIGVFLAVFV